MVTETKVAKEEMTNLICNIDNQPMTKKVVGDSVQFNCSSCGQNWTFAEWGVERDGEIHFEIHSSCTILDVLWPSGMKEDSKMYKEEFLPHWLAKNKFRANAHYESGFITAEVRDERIALAEETLAKWHEDHPPKEYPLWMFWKKE